MSSAMLWKGGAYIFGNADRNARNSSSMAFNAPATTDGTAAAAANADGTTDAEIPKRKMKPKFDSYEHLLGDNGLKLIAEKFPQMYKSKKTFRKGKGNEKYNLQKLLLMYKEWAFIMFPSTNFEDVVTKTEQCSGKNGIHSYLQTLRDKRDGYDNNNNDDDDDDDIDVANADNMVDIDNALNPKTNTNANNVLRRTTLDIDDDGSAASAAQQRHGNNNGNGNGNHSQNNVALVTDGNLQQVLQQRAQRLQSMNDGNASVQDNATANKKKNAVSKDIDLDALLLAQQEHEACDDEMELANMMYDDY